MYVDKLVDDREPAYLLFANRQAQFALIVTFLTNWHWTDVVTALLFAIIVPRNS